MVSMIPDAYRISSRRGSSIASEILDLPEPGGVSACPADLSVQHDLSYLPGQADQKP